MKREVEAVYDGEALRPVTPVGALPANARLRVTIEVAPPYRPTPEEREARVAELQRLAEAAFGGLTPDEEQALRAARLDDHRFFDRSSS
jgi:hypothetical protein